MGVVSAGGHASPYHYHYNMSCTATYTLGHSPLMAVALDGRGVYGYYEVRSEMT